MTSSLLAAMDGGGEGGVSAPKKQCGSVWISSMHQKDVDDDTPIWVPCSLVAIKYPSCKYPEGNKPGWRHFAAKVDAHIVTQFWRDANVALK